VCACVRVCVCVCVCVFFGGGGGVDAPDAQHAAVSEARASVSCACARRTWQRLRQPQVPGAAKAATQHVPTLLALCAASLRSLRLLSHLLALARPHVLLLLLLLRALPGMQPAPLKWSTRAGRCSSAGVRWLAACCCCCCWGEVWTWRACGLLRRAAACRRVEHAADVVASPTHTLVWSAALALGMHALPCRLPPAAGAPPLGGRRPGRLACASLALAGGVPACAHVCTWCACVCAGCVWLLLLPAAALTCVCHGVVGAGHALARCLPVAHELCVCPRFSTQLQLVQCSAGPKRCCCFGCGAD
jgi:hypothetical protein